MRNNNKKLLTTIIIVVAVIIGTILIIGFTTEGIRQERVIDKVHDQIIGKLYYGKEASTDYYMTLVFDFEKEDSVKINFATEENKEYFLTFKGTYELYFEGRNLMLEISYEAEDMDYTFQTEKFRINYDRSSNVTALTNIGPKGETSNLYLEGAE
jgi:hypothetical protein